MIIDKFYWREPTKVIPTIFDDSLSYYELICKILKKLNESIDILNDHTAKFAQYDEQFEEVNELVAEVNEKLAQFEDDVETALEQAGEAKALSEQLAGEIDGILESITSILSRVTSLETVTSALDDDIAVLQATVAGLATNKQDKLISGINIKTINNQSVLGAGNIDVSGGGGGGMVDDVKVDGTSVVSNRVATIDLSGKLDASKSAVSGVGGLVIPNTAPSAPVIVGVGTGREQVQMAIGDGLELSGSTSPYTLKAVAGEYVADNPIDIEEMGDGTKHIQWVAQQGYNMYFDRSGGANLRIDSRPTNVFEVSISGSTVTLLNGKTVEDIAEAFSHYGVIELRKIDGLYIEKCYHLNRFSPAGTVVFSTITEDTANTTKLEVITFDTSSTPMEDLTTGTIKTKTISF